MVFAQLASVVPFSAKRKQKTKDKRQKAKVNNNLSEINQSLFTCRPLPLLPPPPLPLLR